MNLIKKRLSAHKFGVRLASKPHTTQAPYVKRDKIAHLYALIYHFCHLSGRRSVLSHLQEDVKCLNVNSGTPKKGKQGHAT